MAINMYSKLFFSCLIVIIIDISGTKEILIEGRYNGDKYQSIRNGKDLKNLEILYQSDEDKSDDKSVEESRNFKSFSDMINQFTNVIHNQLINGERFNRITHDEGRGLKRDPKDMNDKDDLYYHFYPHNQHMFNLPECATQQVCNAVYKRLNFTQPLCACPPLSDPCSASYLSNDQHTIELKIGDPNTKAVTLIKTCEATWSVRNCKPPTDWSILALQNTRTGKAHYLVICKCPDNLILDGPASHDQPPEAQVPGIRVYGMVCRSPDLYRRSSRSISEKQDPFPWSRVSEVFKNEELMKDLLHED